MPAFVFEGPGARLKPRPHTCLACDKILGNEAVSRHLFWGDDRPLYGPLMNLPEMVHEPLNELGVVFAFGLVARQLGFSVLRFQTAFPDCEALREVVKGQLQRMKLEFEFESRNFLRHGHRIDGCDGIVCWKHNWKECPLEVIELRKVFARIAKIADIAKE